MNFNHPERNSSTIAIRVMCAIVFCLFAFAWLFFFQGDVLAVIQHWLSQEQTHYDRTIGAVLITLLLMLVQLGVLGLTRLTRRWHALTYVPSFVGLAMLSATSIDHWWVCVVVLVVWLVAVYVARGFQPYEPETTFSRNAWVNLLVMVLLMAGATGYANTNAVFHYRTRAEACLKRADVDGALAVGRRSLETDESLTMLRVHALARKGLLGEQLFEYPVTGTSADMLPLHSRSECLILPTDTIYKYLGARPLDYLTMAQYFNVLEHTGMAAPVVADYVLCGYLIDRDLDGFARHIGRYYATDSLLPKHYREALTLYTHLRSNPVVDFRDAVAETDYADFRALEKQHTDAAGRKYAVMDKYGQSYWYYYHYR